MQAIGQTWTLDSEFSVEWVSVSFSSFTPLSHLYLQHRHTEPLMSRGIFTGWGSGFWALV
jgi:hypothetical protein